MGNKLAWEERYNIGVDVIDKEHRKLFKIINKLFSFEDENAKSQWACMEGIKYFKDHAMHHFADEEAYMSSINYEGLERHKRIHDDFRKVTLPALESELAKTRYSMDSIGHFLGVCVGWLIGHTLTEDQAMIGHAESIWKNLLPEKEHEILTQIIERLIFDIFRLKAHVISENYGGERFGKGIYYRLVYTNKADGGKQEAILVFEEKTIINTQGKLMDENATKLTMMMVNAARYTAQQFVDCINKQIPMMEGYKLRAENLLTYEQFSTVFEKDQPQFSVLFDTDAGYFAYCTIAKNRPIKLEHAIKSEESALAEVDSYLHIIQDENLEEEQKKKILIVDDSALMLQAIKNLLCKDYIIETADSGLAALRCIVLDRPDLVLLDYEMPICDGKQILEMMRAEKSMADIDVMFLTGAGDPERVKNVMALKPAGYLLKTQPPSEIKKTVDAWFSRKAND